MAGMSAQYQNFSGPPVTPGAAPPLALNTLLETFIPGFSLLTNLFSVYFHIDITQYLWSIVAFLALSAGLQYCKDAFFNLFNDYLVSTAEIHFDDELYNYLMLWISKQGISQASRHFLAATHVNSSMVYTPDEDDEDDKSDPELNGDGALADPDDQNANWDQMKTLHYTPAYGTHYFRYQGRWLSVTRAREENKVAWGSQYSEQVYLSCLGRDPSILKALLHEAQRAYLARDGGKTIIYRATRDAGSAGAAEWARCLSRPPRPMSTVVLDQAQKDMIIDDMREYLHPWTRKWYANRGIPYRRGYLLHGPPGTGKTSLCFAAAGLLRLRIYVVSLNSRTLSEEALAGLFRDLPWRCIVLLEDIDSAGLTAKRAAPAAEQPADGDDAAKNENKPPAADGAAGPDAAAAPKGISLSGFLNIIDGVASAEGRILVMTTNHIEKLDPAILRPGRVDRIVHFGYANAEVIAGLFKAIFSSVEAERAGVLAAANGVAAEPEHKMNGVPATPAEKKTATPAEKKTRHTKSVSVALASWHAQRYHNKSDEEIAALAERFGERMPADEFTPAEIQGYLLQHKYNPEDALEGVEKWMEARRAEKKVQKTGV